MKKLLAVYLMSIIALLATHNESEEPPTPTTTSITFVRPIQILMPGDLCDNLQGTLQFWVKSVLEAPYDKRQYWNDKVVETRNHMKEVGCG
jgi:hypothetical protein